jgi:hypothetical protein
MALLKGQPQHLPGKISEWEVSQQKYQPGTCRIYRGSANHSTTTYDNGPY